MKEEKFDQFIDLCREELHPEDLDYLKKQTAGFKAGKLTSSELFEVFIECFGLKHVLTAR